MIKEQRFEYWEESDTAYDTKIQYGQYFRIIDKKQMVDLLNKQELMIESLKNEAQRQNKQKKNLIDYLKNKKHYSIGKIKKIMNKEWW